MYVDYAIKGDQMKAIKEVEKAMRKAKKLGIHFWDNYGFLCAYNDNIIYCPVPHETAESSPLVENHIYRLRVDNFHAGNADDGLFVTFK